MIEKEWAVGFKDRGHGHGDFAVIVADTTKVVVKCPSHEIAEHIVEAHNTFDRKDREIIELKSEILTGIRYAAGGLAVLCASSLAISAIAKVHIIYWGLAAPSLLVAGCVFLMTSLIRRGYKAARETNAAKPKPHTYRTMGTDSCCYRDPSLSQDCGLDRDDPAHHNAERKR